MEIRAMDVKAMWHPHDLSELQGILNGNVLLSTIDPCQKPPIWEESHKITLTIVK